MPLILHNLIIILIKEQYIYILPVYLVHPCIDIVFFYLHMYTLHPQTITIITIQWTHIHSVIIYLVAFI